MPRSRFVEISEQDVLIRSGSAVFEGTLICPPVSYGAVIFSHGSGSGRKSTRNRYVAGVLQKAGFCTLLFNMLTDYEAHNYASRFNIPLLASRLVAATEWLAGEPDMRDIRIGYYGSSTGAAAALSAAAELGPRISAVVSRGGRPDLARNALPVVKCPVLLIVGGNDLVVLELNQLAYNEIGSGERKIKIIPGAGHLFEERGKLEEVARLAAEWFSRHLKTAL